MPIYNNRVDRYRLRYDRMYSRNRGKFSTIMHSRRFLVLRDLSTTLYNKYKYLLFRLYKITR